MIGIKPLVGILSFNDAIMFLECCSSFVVMFCSYNSLFK